MLIKLYFSLHLQLQPGPYCSPQLLWSPPMTQPLQQCASLEEHSPVVSGARRWNEEQSKGVEHNVRHACSAYLFLKWDLREIVDGTIVSCVHLARKVAEIATILEEMYNVNFKKEQRGERERERERESSQGMVFLAHIADPTDYKPVSVS